MYKRQVLDWVSSDDFDRMLVGTIAATYPEQERDWFTGHFRGLVDLWISDERTRTAASPT